MSRTIATALPVWVAVVAAVALMVVVVPVAEWWPLLSAIAAGAVLLTFVIQVSLQSKDGLVMRMFVTVAGAIGLLMIVSMVTLIVQSTLGSAS